MNIRYLLVVIFTLFQVPQALPMAEQAALERETELKEKETQGIKQGEEAAAEASAGQSSGSKIGAQVKNMWQKVGSWFKTKEEGMSTEVKNRQWLDAITKHSTDMAHQAQYAKALGRDLTYQESQNFLNAKKPIDLLQQHQEKVVKALDEKINQAAAKKDVDKIQELTKQKEDLKIQYVQQNKKIADLTNKMIEAHKVAGKAGDKTELEELQRQRSDLAHQATLDIMTKQKNDVLEKGDNTKAQIPAHELSKQAEQSLEQIKKDAEEKRANRIQNHESLVEGFKKSLEKEKNLDEQKMIQKNIDNANKRNKSQLEAIDKEEKQATSEVLAQEKPEAAMAYSRKQLLQKFDDNKNELEKNKERLNKFQKEAAKKIDGVKEDKTLSQEQKDEAIKVLEEHLGQAQEAIKGLDKAIKVNEDAKTVHLKRCAKQTEPLEKQPVQDTGVRILTKKEKAANKRYITQEADVEGIEKSVEVQKKSIVQTAKDAGAKLQGKARVLKEQIKTTVKETGEKIKSAAQAVKEKVTVPVKKISDKFGDMFSRNPEEETDVKEEPVEKKLVEESGFKDLDEANQKKLDEKEQKKKTSAEFVQAALAKAKAENKARQDEFEAQQAQIKAGGEINEQLKNESQEKLPEVKSPGEEGQKTVVKKPALKEQMMDTGKKIIQTIKDTGEKVQQKVQDIKDKASEKKADSYVKEEADRLGKSEEEIKADLGI